ncbi:MAG: HEAT repeat domain-containing protein [Acidobacteria bacterium]|nr:HEAT repeat domain-containing protein [Acidobacteriota bacterium]
MGLSILRTATRKGLGVLPLLLVLGCCREDIGKHIGDLNSVDPTVRAEAAFESAKKRSRATEFLPHLVRLLQDDTQLRIQFRGRNMPNIWSLTSPAEEADRAIRIIGPIAVPQLIESFKTDRASEKDRRINLLRYFGDGAFSTLLTYLDNPDGGIRAGAAVALGLMNDARALPKLTTLIGDPVLEVQEEVLLAIGLLGPPPGILEQVIPLVLDRSEERWTRQRRALLVFCRIDEPRTTDLKLEFLRDRPLKDSKLERELLDSLSRIPDERAMNELFSIAIDPDYELSNRAEAARQSMVQAGRRAEDFLLAQLDAREIPRRQWAAYLLGDMKSKKSVDRLIPMCREVQLRHWAVEALGKIGEARSLPPILEALEMELRRPFEGPGGHRRVADICTVLGNFDDKRAVPTLIKALKPLYHRDLDLVENEYEIRDATAALARLTGVTSLGQDFRKWQDWWARNKDAWPGFPSE